MALRMTAEEQSADVVVRKGKFDYRIYPISDAALRWLRGLATCRLEQDQRTGYNIGVPSRHDPPRQRDSPSGLPGARPFLHLKRTEQSLASGCRQGG